MAILRIASMCLNGVARVGGGGCLLGAGLAAQVFGCVAKGSAQGLPNAGLLVASDPAGLLPHMNIFLATGQATMADPECSQLLLGGCPPTLTQVMNTVNEEAELIGLG